MRASTCLISSDGVRWGGSKKRQTLADLEEGEVGRAVSDIVKDFEELGWCFGDSAG